MDTVDPPTAVLPDVVALPAPPRPPRTRPRWPGILSLGLGALTVAATITGIVLATSDQYQAATYAAYAAIGTSALSVLAAVAALFVRRSRAAAIAGAAIAVVANPVVLTRGLDLIGRLWT